MNTQLIEKMAEVITQLGGDAQVAFIAWCITWAVATMMTPICTTVAVLGVFWLITRTARKIVVLCSTNRDLAMAFGARYSDSGWNREDLVKAKVILSEHYNKSQGKGG